MSAYPRQGHGPVRPIVTAVLVAHDGMPWLDKLAEGLRGQRRRPDRFLVVDTGSRDGTRERLVEVFGQRLVLDAPRRTGFGEAVNRAVRALPPAQPGEWLWLLHDDCTPAPGALAGLLRLAGSSPSVAVIGPKLREWPEGRRLIEFGVTIAGSSNRETGLEFGEYDQGQHDVVRDVLAVSTAGMLIRRDVFERLGGFDERFGLYRDDVDLGWRVVRSGHRVVVCPDAVVFHAEASFRGLRRTDAVKGRPRRVDRRNAMYTLLVNTALWLLPFVALRLALGTTLRVLALLLAKWPDAAFDEAMAALAVFSRPDRILLGRRRRAKHRRVPHRVVRQLLPPPWIGLQHTFDALLALVSARTGTHVSTTRRIRRPVESGPVAEEAEELESGGPGVLRWIVTRPPIVTLLALVVLTLVAGRHLIGGGVLSGGALLPPPESVSDLWQRYVESWHPVDLGSSRAAAPYLPVLALLASILGGQVGLAVDLLLLGSVPLAGLTSYVLLRSLVRSRLVRIWAATTYALLPAVTGAIASGRLGTCAAVVLLPLVAVGALRMVGAGRAEVGSWSSAWTTGLLLAVVTAFVPAGYLVAVILGVAVCLGTWLPHPGARSRIGLALAIPPGALLPWLPTLVENPRAVLAEAGLSTPTLVDAKLGPLSLVFGNPGGPAAAPAWMTGILLLIALAALLRRDRAKAVLAAWLFSVAGLAIGLMQSRLMVQAEWIPTPVPSWPGLATVVVVAGWILAIALVADGATRVFSETAFSWRQPVAGLLAILAVAVPGVMASWWILRGAEGPLTRGPGDALPAYMQSAQRRPSHPRALVIRADGGTVRYAVVREGSVRLGDAEVGGSRSTLRQLDSLVGDLLSDVQQPRITTQLAAYGIRYVYLPAPADSRSVERLDTTPGLSRTSAPDGAAAWQVQLPAGAARVMPAGSGGASEAVGEVVALDDRTGRIAIPDGPVGRVLVLAETYDSGWQADFDGRPLPSRTYDGWAQAFDLPAGSGSVTVTHVAPNRGALLVIQGIVVLLILIFALPSRSRRDVPAPPPREPRRRAGVRPPSPPGGGPRSGQPTGRAGVPQSPVRTNAGVGA